MKYRSEGEEEGLKIRAAADQERSRLLSEAYKVSQQHRGQGDADAARIYAEALGKAPEFYRFLRTMEATRKFVGRTRPWSCRRTPSCSGCSTTAITTTSAGASGTPPAAEEETPMR